MDRHPETKTLCVRADLQAVCGQVELPLDRDRQLDCTGHQHHGPRLRVDERGRHQVATAGSEEGRGHRGRHRAEVTGDLGGGDADRFTLLRRRTVPQRVDVSHEPREGDLSTRGCTNCQQGLWPVNRGCDLSTGVMTCQQGSWIVNRGHKLSTWVTIKIGHRLSTGDTNCQQESYTVNRGHHLSTGVTIYHKGSQTVNRGHGLPTGVTNCQQGLQTAKRGHHLSTDVTICQRSPSVNRGHHMSTEVTICHKGHHHYHRVTVTSHLCWPVQHVGAVDAREGQGRLVGWQEAGQGGAHHGDCCHGDEGRLSDRDEGTTQTTHEAVNCREELGRVAGGDVAVGDAGEEGGIASEEGDDLRTCRTTVTTVTTLTTLTTHWPHTEDTDHTEHHLVTTLTTMFWIYIFHNIPNSQWSYVISPHKPWLPYSLPPNP